MSDARLPINHGDTGKVSRDKINDSFNDVVNTVAGYRPHIEAGYWYIGTTNTGVKAKGDSVEMKEEDGYVWYKSESNGQWTQIIAIEDLKGDKGDTGDAATITLGTVCTGAAGSDACITNSGTTCAAIFNFTIPRGATGCTGATGASICAAEFCGDDMVFTKDDGCTVTLSGAKTDLKGADGCPGCNGCNGCDGQDGQDGASICAAAFSGNDIVFTEDNGCTVTLANAKTCLKGDTGAAATVSVGTTTTGGAGTCACVTNTGTSCAAVLDFVIPTGAEGPAGNGICCVTSTKNGKTTTVDITCTNGCSYCFQVQDGADGQGSGDMCASTYDPTNKSADAFDYCNFHNTPTIPTDNCQLANSCGFITNAVNDLTNYYLKCETYKKCEVDNLISNFGGFEVVSTLPTQNIKTNVIYLKGPIGTGTDRYEEWIYYSNTWTQIGETSVDLTNYAKCCDIPTDNCQLANSCGFTTCTGTLVASDLNGYAQTNSLCTVATSGKYCDLTGTPTLCTVATSGKYCDLTGTPTIPTDNCQLANGCGYTTCTGTVTSSDLASYVTNACVACINGCCLTQGGDICIQGGAESNTKTFCMACNNDLVTAQAAYDWYKAGNNPIICYCQRSYITSGKDGKHLPFTSTNIYYSNYNSYGCTQNLICNLTLCSADGTTVCGTYVGSCMAGQGYLATHVNYTTPYNPEYPGSPTTKKYVDECVVYKCSTAPASPTEGLLWYDTSSDVLKTYDGAQWNALTSGGGAGTGDVTGPNSSVDGHIAVFDSTSGKIIKDGGPVPEGKSYCEGVGICIEDTYCDYSAMRGPAPEGFHVPSKDEWVSLVGTLTNTFSMAATCDTPKTYLKIPVASYLNMTSGGLVTGEVGCYWASTACGTERAYYLGVSSSAIKTACSYIRSYGFSIRAFSDSPVIPDSSWTTLYDGSGVAAGAGIFHNATLGLISISGDGANWTTIADKNVGATTVYNNGDTVSESNSGGFFQRGNNYMFPHTGATTTSTTQADTTGCGPGSYYCCSTYIKRSADPYDWSCVQNNNLWGGTTGVTCGENRINNTGVISVNGQTGYVNVTVPTDNCQLSNGCGYTTCTGTISTCSQIISTLGYTPYNSTNPSGYTACTGTITGICMNGASKGTSGVVNLGTVITAHQNIKTVNNQTITGTGNVSVGTLCAETVVSGDTGCTYTIKKATTAPVSASNNTITFVTE